MLRTCTALIVVAAGAALTGCNDSMNAMGDRSGEPQTAVRFDQNGNKIYDPSVRNTRSEDMVGSNRSGQTWDSANGRWTNDRPRQYESGYTQEDRRTKWNDQGVWKNWKDAEVSNVQRSDLPRPVLATFERESTGGELMETSWASIDGRKCYCSKVKKDGMTYKIISDADGNLLGMKRVD